MSAAAQSRTVFTTLRILVLYCFAFLSTSAAFGADVPGDDSSALAAYESGDYAQAFLLFEPLAANGDANAQFMLGLMYANGQGVAQNFYEAAKMYRRAGNQGHIGAQVNLGSLFDECLGNGPCNSEEAANWYRRAADRGDAVAQYNLGVMYGIGRGVAEDEWTAKTLFRNSAEQGYAPAQYNLAVSYERGLGGPVDRIEAYAWYDLAAERGYADGINGRDKIAARLSVAELAEAEAMSRSLKESYAQQ
jgi:TPR repeat protein